MLGEYKDHKQIAIVQNTDVGVGCRSALMCNDKLLNLHFDSVSRLGWFPLVDTYIFVFWAFALTVHFYVLMHPRYGREF